MLSSGFFNSNNHDKKYYASDVSRLFNALITDGIFENVGNCFIARAGEGMTVIIQSGMAYFNSTWTVNDADYVVNINSAPYVTGFKRIDGIFLRSFPETAVAHRDNEIYYLEGREVSENPEKPIPEAVEGEVFTPLCYVTVNNGDNEIPQSNIENYIGKTKAPFVTGIVETVDISDLLSQWQSQWDSWLNSKNRNYEGWFSGKETEFTEWFSGKETEFTQWFSEKKTAFTEWFNNLQVVLDGDVAGHLQNEIDTIRPKVTTNLLNPTLKTTTMNGVTCTANDDGTYTLNGTETGQGTNFCLRTNMELETKKYRWIAEPSENDSTKVTSDIVTIAKSNGARAILGSDVSGRGLDFTPEPEKYKYECRLHVQPNSVISNLTFKPMLTTDLQATYADYVEYSGDGELNENVARLSKRIPYELSAVAGNLALTENGNTATRKYYSGNHLVWKGTYYKVRKTIETGDAFVVDDNIEDTTVGEEIGELKVQDTLMNNKITSKVKVNGTAVNSINFTLSDTTLIITTS